MKTTLYTTAIAILLLVTACRSVEKLVDQGRYDEAIVLATKKLSGKKKKKTKHIIALEEAFVKVNRYDLGHIELLKGRAKKGDALSWEAIYDYALKISARQERIIPFLPLVSKDNYVGAFDLIDTEPILAESAAQASDYFYNLGKERMTEFETIGDKLLAQEAHYAFQKIGRYLDDYKDVRTQLAQSNEAGTFHVLLKSDEDFRNSFSLDFITHKELQRIQKRWTHYHVGFTEGVAFDAVSTMGITEINISPENEVVNNFNESKELERWVDERDREGNVVRDTLGNAIQYREVEIVRATITEIIRSKEARIRGIVETRDYNTGALIDSDRFTHDISFASDACNLLGDRRAISDGFRKRLDLTLRPFPTDFDMISEGVTHISDDFLRHIKRLDYERYYRDHLAFR